MPTKALPGANKGLLGVRGGLPSALGGCPVHMRGCTSYSRWHLWHSVKAGVFGGHHSPAGTPVLVCIPMPAGLGGRGLGKLGGGEAELGSLVVAPAGFGTRMPLFVWPRSGFQGCQRRGGSGRVGAPEVWEPPRVPLSAPLSFSTALAALAVPGREGCWMLLLAAAMTHQPRGAVAGNHRHPRRSPPDTAPAPQHCLWQPWGSSSRHCPTSCAVEPWEASQSPGKRVGAVGSVSEPWQRAGSVAGVAGASHGTRVPFQEVFPTRQLLSPRLGPPAPPGSLSPQHRWDAAAAVGLSRGSAPCHAMPCRASPSPHSWALLLTWFILAGLCHVGF